MTDEKKIEEMITEGKKNGRGLFLEWEELDQLKREVAKEILDDIGGCIKEYKFRDLFKEVFDEATKELRQKYLEK